MKLIFNWLLFSNLYKKYKIKRLFLLLKKINQPNVLELHKYSKPNITKN